MPTVGVFVPFSVVFPDEPNDFDSFKAVLQRLSRSDGLIWCCRVNLALGRPETTDPHAVQQRLVQLFLPRARIKLLDQWARSQGYQRGCVALFFRDQLLDLATWLAKVGNDKPEDGTTFNDECVREDFCRAALLTGEAWGARAFADGLTSSGNTKRDRKEAARSLRRSVSGAKHMPWLPRLLARSSVIHEHGLLKHYPRIEETLQEAVGSSLAQYQAFTAVLASHVAANIARHAMDSPPFIHLSTFADNFLPGPKSAFPRYRASISQTPTDLATASKQEGTGWDIDFDYLPLRQRPILRFPGNRDIATDLLFLADKLTVGPLFEVVRTDRGRANEAFGAFGRGVEHYVQMLLSAMLPDRPGLARRVHPSPTGKGSGGVVELADLACLLDGQNFALLEVKAAFLRESAVRSGGARDYTSAVLDKYAGEPGTGQAERRLGVRQLATSIKALAEVRISWELLSDDTEYTIYPILLVYDELMASPGHGELLGEAFIEALQLPPGPSLPTVKLGRLRVRPLVLATVGDLEILENSLELASFLEVLDGYIGSGMAHSLHDYLAENSSRLRLKESELTAKLSEDLLDRSCRTLFGTTCDDPED